MNVATLDPNNATAYSNRGSANVALGRIGDAQTDFQTALLLAQTASDKELITAISKKLREIDNRGTE